MSRLYFWSDLHFFDAHIAASRGYDTVEDHNEAIAEAWSRTVRPRDIVYMLGDLSIYEVSKSLDLVSSLPGAKRIIYGNHDPAHPMFRKSDRYQRRFLEVFETGGTVGTVRLAKQLVMLSHFPYQGDHTPEDRHVPFRPQRGTENYPLIHGHVHGLWGINGNQFNAGVEIHPEPVPSDFIVEHFLQAK